MAVTRAPRQIAAPVIADAGWLATLLPNSPDEAHPFLDAGEASCPVAASRHKISLLVIDEGLGRREAGE